MLSSIWQWIIAASGVATAGVGLAAFLAPRMFLRFGFGLERPQSSTTFFVRHWGILTFVVGALLVYSVDAPVLRTPVLIAAAVEKFAFGLVIFLGSVTRTNVMKAAAIGDGLFAIVYISYIAQH
jgi:hypothetical protein